MTDLREQRREETRRRLYQAALEAFRREDVATCRIDDIARAAGVSRGSFYFHYPTKDDVLLEYMRETEQRITASVDKLPKNAPLHEVLETVITAFAAVWQPDPRLLPDVVAVGLRFTATVLTDKESMRLRNALAERFATAARRGELSTLLPSQILSDIYLGHTVAGLLAWYGHQETPLKIVLQSTNTLFFGGVLVNVEKSPLPVPAKSKSPAKKSARKPLKRIARSTRTTRR